MANSPHLQPCLYQAENTQFHVWVSDPDSCSPAHLQMCISLKQQWVHSVCEHCIQPLTSSPSLSECLLEKLRSHVPCLTIVDSGRTGFCSWGTAWEGLRRCMMASLALSRSAGWCGSTPLAQQWMATFRWGVVEACGH